MRDPRSVQEAFEELGAAGLAFFDALVMSLRVPEAVEWLAGAIERVRRWRGPM